MPSDSLTGQPPTWRWARVLTTDRQAASTMHQPF